MRGGRLVRRVRTFLDPRAADGTYECPDCSVTYEQWPGDCAECGQVVVRVVDARPVPDH